MLICVADVIPIVMAACHFQHSESLSMHIYGRLWTTASISIGDFLRIVFTELTQNISRMREQFSRVQIRRCRECTNEHSAFGINLRSLPAPFLSNFSKRNYNVSIHYNDLVICVQLTLRIAYVIPACECGVPCTYVASRRPTPHHTAIHPNACHVIIRAAGLMVLMKFQPCRSAF